MIPTIIVIHDANVILKRLHTQFEGVVRTFHRTSIQGEQLYGIFEGVIFCDEKGNHRFKRRDEYTNLFQEVLTHLASLTGSDERMLREYIVANTLRPDINMFRDEDLLALKRFITKYYE